MVSTNIGDLRKNYSEIVKVADNKEEFLINIEAVINLSAGDRKNLINKIVTHPRRNSWEKSADLLIELMDKLILKSRWNLSVNY